MSKCDDQRDQRVQGHPHAGERRWFNRDQTALKRCARPSPLADAFAFSRVLLEQPNTTVIEPGERHWKIFETLCRESAAAENMVQDAWFAALSLESGCEWVTVDRDYSRFKGLRWHRSRTASALARRARILLACAEGNDNKIVARRLRVSPPTVCKWRARFVRERVDGLYDQPPPGAPRRITDEQIEQVIIRNRNFLTEEIRIAAEISKGRSR